MGFFTASTLAAAKPTVSKIPKCGICRLHLGCNSPKMPVDGKGRKRILICAEAPGCVAGNTLIETAFRDKSKYPNGIPIRKLVGREEFYVYCFDVKQQKLVLGLVKRVWKTGRKKTWRVTYEWTAPVGGKHVVYRDSIVITSNHPFLMKKYIPHDPFGCGKNNKPKKMYMSLDDGLSIGSALQPFLRRHENYGYVGTSWRTVVKESRFLLSQKIGRPLVEKEECHHVDENKLNDKWINLNLLTTEDHARYHITKLNPMDRPEVRQKHAKVMRSKKYRDAMSKKMKEVLKDPLIYAQHLESLALARVSHQPSENHKIIAIEYVGVQDVYDMEVNEYHNFATQGIFVHNSEEDEQGIPLVGRAGQHLEKHLQRVGIDMRRDCWLTNSLLCRPPNNETPTPNQIEWCRPNLFNTIEKYKPDIILCFGLPAVKSLIGHIWREDVGPMKRWAGFIIPSQNPNCFICPTYHPSYLLRQNDPVLELHFHRHLKAAVAREGKPWRKLPNYEQQVQVLFEPSKAAKALRAFIAARPKLVAVDLETDRLKGDHKESEIVCCAVSDGETTIAYPWHGVVIELTKQLITDVDVGKIASNMKFEHRWFRRVLSVEVVNWAWDTMQCAHVLDNRNGITGLKFQAFVRLGQPSYDDHIKEYLHAKNSNQPNRIRELDLHQLLVYNGMDALLEVIVAKQQMEELGYTHA